MLFRSFLKSSKLWAGDLLSEDADSEFKLWLKVQQSLTYIFEQDLNHLFDLVDRPDDLLKVEDGQYPLLYNQYLQDSIYLETVVILDDVLNFFPMWEKKIEDDIVFPDFLFKCKKYKPFLHYDKLKFKTLLKDRICQSA